MGALLHWRRRPATELSRRREPVTARHSAVLLVELDCARTSAQWRWGLHVCEDARDGPTTPLVPQWENDQGRVGLHALGIGPGADPDVIDAVARTAETVGFSTLWSGEHVVMVDQPGSPYPYAPDGRIAVPADADWLDPLATLAFVAAATSRIRVATGVLLLPEHNPVVVAKQAASLDVLSRGRLLLGIGVGWSA